jgi:hypothetical protein
LFRFSPFRLVRKKLFVVQRPSQIAAAKSVGYQTQLRMWIAEGIRLEGKQAR